MLKETGMSFKTALVLGGGAFGTSIAFDLAQNFEKVIIKVRSNDIYEQMKSGENTVYLPGQKIPQKYCSGPYMG